MSTGTPEETYQALLASVLTDAADMNASDVHFGEEEPPWVRRGATFDPLEDVQPPPGFAEYLYQSVKDVGGMDSAMLVVSGTRWRSTAFDSVNGRRIAFRLIPEVPPPLQQLGIRHDDLVALPQRRDGLVLVVGGTGSGKTTTVASMLDVVNATRSVNILTIEDPVEYLLVPQRARITQQSVHSDELDAALETALRSDMDVVLLGECRTEEQIRMCLRLASTGHLVFSTLHARNTTTALNLLCGDGGTANNTKVAQSVAAVIAQQLEPHRDDPHKRVLVTEVLIVDHATRMNITRGEMQRIEQTQRSAGATMDHQLYRSVQSGHLSDEAARAAAIDPAEYDAF